MLIQQLIRTDPEKVVINVKNVEATTITTGMGVCLCMGIAGAAASADGVNAIKLGTGAGTEPAFVGVAKGDIASNGYGLVVAWGFTSVYLSQETDKTIGCLVNENFLTKGGLAGSFTSTLKPEAISTFAGKYVFNAVTTNISGALPRASAFVRAI